MLKYLPYFLSEFSVGKIEFIATKKKNYYLLEIVSNPIN